MAQGPSLVQECSDWLYTYPDLTAGLAREGNDSSRVQDVEQKQRALDKFLKSVERPAYRTAEIATRNPDDALDIVQDAMIKLVQKYFDKPENEWRPLFYAILHSRITDYHRKKTLTSRIFAWVGTADDEDEPEPGVSLEDPLELMSEALTLERLEGALAELPTRQSQVFLLRTWQGFSVAETAGILKCSEGSVKTHLSRATEALMKAINQDAEND